MSSLAETLRPDSLDRVVGNDSAKRTIKSWIDKDNFPRCVLLSGPVGTGKSTLAAIIARACQGPDGYENAVIRQINAGTVGKVDDMRELVAQTISRPLSGRYRVLILEEAQRLTDSSQDAILVPMETNESTVWILTSSDPSKLLPAIRSRCSAATFDLKPLRFKEIEELVYTAGLTLDKELSRSSKIAEFLVQSGITSPREILGVLDLHLSGTPLEQCISGAEHEPLYKEVASAVLAGNWGKTAAILSQIPTSDYRGMIGIVSAFLAGALLKESVGPRADCLATCLVGLGSNQFQDGVAYAATKGTLYKCCRALSK